MNRRIFISYSSRDAIIIEPMVNLMKLSECDIFRDTDSIKPGKLWRAEIVSAIEHCDILVLFWCCHSSISKEVSKEYKKALRLRKSIVPVLLDDSKLPTAVKKFQWIDMRIIFGKERVHLTDVPEHGFFPDLLKSEKELKLLKPDQNLLLRSSKFLKHSLIDILMKHE